ncbi:hypothetical protein ACLB2K_053232 [Fragaria x ananassa]
MQPGSRSKFPFGSGVSRLRDVNQGLGNTWRQLGCALLHGRWIESWWCDLGKDVVPTPTKGRRPYMEDGGQTHMERQGGASWLAAVIISIHWSRVSGVREVQVFGDSLLVVNQLVVKFKYLSSSIEPYLRNAFDVLDRFDDVHIEHIPREFNFAANELAQIASSLSLRDGVRERLLKIERRSLPSFIAMGQYQTGPLDVAALDPIDEDWRLPFIAYLKGATRERRNIVHSFVNRGDAVRFTNLISGYIPACYAMSREPLWTKPSYLTSRLGTTFQNFGSPQRDEGRDGAKMLTSSNF